MPAVTNVQNVIDSREVVARLEELRLGLASPPPLVFELDELEALAASCQQYVNWPHGMVLVRDSYWPQYAAEISAQLGKDMPARELQATYVPVDFAGVTYWLKP